MGFHSRTHLNNLGLIQFTEKLINTVKLQWIQSGTDVLHSLGGLYFLYCIYFKQPILQYCKIRVTKQEWGTIKEMYEKFSECKIFEAKAIFWKLLQFNAFRFVADDMVQHFITSNKDAAAARNSERDLPMHHITTLTNNSSGLLPMLEITQHSYNEMKMNLEVSESEKKAYELPSTNIFENLTQTLKKVESILKFSEAVIETEKCPFKSLPTKRKSDIGSRRNEIRNKAFKSPTKAFRESPNKAKSETMKSDCVLPSTSNEGIAIEGENVTITFPKVKKYERDRKKPCSQDSKILRQELPKYLFHIPKFCNN